MSAHATLVAVTQPDVAVVDDRTIRRRQRPARRTRDPRLPFARRRPRALRLRASYALELLGESTERVGYLHQRPPRQPGRAADAVRRVGRGGSVLDPVVLPQLVGRPAPAPRGPRRASRPQRA